MAKVGIKFVLKAGEFYQEFMNYKVGDKFETNAQYLMITSTGLCSWKNNQQIYTQLATTLFLLCLCNVSETGSEGYISNKPTAGVILQAEKSSNSSKWQERFEVRSNRISNQLFKLKK